MMEKVVIDTNVLVSALLSKQEDSATVKVIGMLLEGKLITIATEVSDWRNLAGYESC